ncbi:MAG: DeoR/GlpR family DNA-binding transcription regulator [Hespellia sp.]|nr:DeoR/GlpR family DNA-binding transcription regulator [Hespellia sp.]
MLAEERFAKITEIVEQKKSVTVLELTQLLGTSESTIRRDLTALHKMNRLIKVHGGATAIEMDYATKDADFAVRKDMNVEEKKVIAKYAADLVKNNDFVYLDAGSSTDYMVDCLEERDAVYVTNAISHAQKLIRRGFKVYLLGGPIKKSTEAIIGVEALKSLEKYNFTKGFFGTNGVDIKHGFTTPDNAEALIKKQAMEQCHEAYVLADSSKIGQISSVKFAEFEDAVAITVSLHDDTMKKYNNIVEVNEK